MGFRIFICRSNVPAWGHPPDSEIPKTNLVRRYEGENSFVIVQRIAPSNGDRRQIHEAESSPYAFWSSYNLRERRFMRYPAPMHL